MRVAYADPPYIGQAKSHYDCEEVDHGELIARLVADYPDGWALSCHTPSLRVLLPLCPEDVRVMAWVKPFAVFRPNVNPAYAWEPVIVRGGRKRGRDVTTLMDWVSAGVVLRRDRFPGAKPRPFCFWLFDCMGLRDGDQLDDLYPGTGAVTMAWAEWCGINHALRGAVV